MSRPCIAEGASSHVPDNAPQRLRQLGSLFPGSPESATHRLQDATRSPLCPSQRAASSVCRPAPLVSLRPPGTTAPPGPSPHPAAQSLPLPCFSFKRHPLFRQPRVSLAGLGHLAVLKPTVDQRSRVARTTPDPPGYPVWGWSQPLLKATAVQGSGARTARVLWRRGPVSA